MQSLYPTYPTERQKHVQTMLQLMYYCKNTGCITKNALGDRYDDFEKHEKYWFFRKKYMSRITPLDPTERYKHILTNTCKRWYKLSSTTKISAKDALGDWYDDSLNDVKNANFRKKYISYQLPISYRTPKTRANDAAAEYTAKTRVASKNALGDRYDDFEKHEKYWFFRKKYISHHSPNPTERYKHILKKMFPHWKFIAFLEIEFWCFIPPSSCIFEKKIHLVSSSLYPTYPTERQKHVQTMLQLMYYCKNTGCITKNALGDRYDDFEKHEKYWFFRKKYVSHHSPRPYRTLQTHFAKNVWKYFWNIFDVLSLPPQLPLSQLPPTPGVPPKLMLFTNSA